MAALTPWDELLIAAGVSINQPYGATYYGCWNTIPEPEETLFSGVIDKPKQDDLLRRTKLRPLTPLGPLYYDDFRHMSLGAKADAYRAMYAETPKHMNRGLTLEEEKRYYMSFRMNIDPTAIRFLIAYYKACGLDTQEERLARFQQIYELQI
jgi:hypothetical protein